MQVVKLLFRGKGEESFEGWVDREYTIDYMIYHKYLKEDAGKERDFSFDQNTKR